MYNKSYKLTLGYIDNEGHWVSSGLYFMLWPEFIWIAYVSYCPGILPFSIPHDLTPDFEHLISLLVNFVPSLVHEIGKYDFRNTKEVVSSYFSIDSNFT